MSIRSQNPSRRSLLIGTAIGLALLRPALVRAAAIKLRSDPIVEDLLRRMTLEEKAGQLTIWSGFTGKVAVNPGDVDRADAAMEDDIRAGRVTGYFNTIDPVAIRALQKVAVEQGRLQIPLLFAADVIHGLHTVFPIPLGEAASFDADLCRRTARATAVESAAAGLHWLFAPVVDVARDQRWGRVAEAAGEDPWLGAQLAAARVRGLQGDSLRASGAVLACPKHFAGYGAVEGGREYSTADISEATLRETHLPPFKAAFDAGAATVMTAFNDIGGVPATADRHLLTGILRDEMHFEGVVVSDYEADRELIAHGFAEDEADAAMKALSAGCDISMQSGLYLKYVPALVRSGKVPMHVIDTAVRRVLRLKSALGLFDDPYRTASAHSGAVAHAALAREAACRSIVLLKNQRDLLPLPTTGKRIAFIGPFVADKKHLFGPWAFSGDATAAIGLEEALAALTPATIYSVTPGCAPLAPIDGGIATAVAAARAADVAVLYLGETSQMSGEAASRLVITLPPAQQALAEAVAATGTPIVVILKHGRALALEGAVRDADAILCGWFLGSQTGPALIDILFGAQSPSGRLPVSFPQASGQEPFYYNRRTTGRPQRSDSEPHFKARYSEVPDRALYPFGHGLTYSRIDYDETALSHPILSRSGSVTVSALLHNRGRRDVREVAQLYIHHRSAQITQPRRSLKNVALVDIPAGQSRLVEFTIGATDIGYVHGDGRVATDPGAVDITVAASSEAGTPKTLIVSA